MMSKTGSFWISAFIIPLFLLWSATPAAAITINTGESSSTSPAISQGDPVYIRGVATGHPQNGLQAWFIGNNYARVTMVQVDSDNTFGYELKAADTQNLASGQYFVLIQHPMMNGEFDITYNAGTGEVINQQSVNTGTGSPTVIFRLTGAGNLQAPAAASALLRAVADQNVDDTFTTVSFYVQPPNALIDPIPDHYVGDRFTITGTTNLAVGDKLMVEITSSSFKPTVKGQSGEFSGSNGIVEVQKGNGGLNRWSFDVDASTYRPDEYIITVSAILQDVRGTRTFTIGERPATATSPSPTDSPITAPLPGRTVASGTSGTPAPTTKAAPASPLGCCAGCFISFCLLFRMRKKF